MADRAEHVAAFERTAELLRTAAAANARALQTYRTTAAGDDLDRQLEHTLDRLALLYGRGTYENLDTTALFESAIKLELRLAREVEPVAAVHVDRAAALVDGSRRGNGLHVHPSATAPTVHRGVYVAPLSRDFERSLHAQHEPYLRWRGGAVVIVEESLIQRLREPRTEVAVLFLDSDELLDLDARGDRPALEAELDRRLAAARAAPDRVGDSRERHLVRTLLHHSIVLRNLRDRLAAEHPAAHAALLPVLADQRAQLEAALVAAAPPRDALGDPLAASIDRERELQGLVTRWAGEPDDPAGLRARFRAVAESGTRLADLERHQR